MNKNDAFRAGPSVKPRPNPLLFLPTVWPGTGCHICGCVYGTVFLLRAQRRNPPRTIRAGRVSNRLTRTCEPSRKIHHVFPIAAMGVAQPRIRLVFLPPPSSGYFRRESLPYTLVSTFCSVAWEAKRQSLVGVRFLQTCVEDQDP